ncbi:hypothetical protein LP421_27875 [Rhizobium sp. RCAM05350]|nr:hypothetical protein LP421_27875 [Rhizobium sp. RCAM05350]
MRQAKAFVVTKSRRCGNWQKLLFLMNKSPWRNVLDPHVHAAGGIRHFSLAGFKKLSRFRRLHDTADKVIHPNL